MCEYAGIYSEYDKVLNKPKIKRVQRRILTKYIKNTVQNMQGHSLYLK